MYKYNYCDYKSTEKDRVTRHEKQTCQSEKFRCECGDQVAKSGLAKHRRTNKHTIAMSRLEGEPRVFPHVERRKVVSNVTITTHEDGSKIIEAEKVIVDGIELVLVACNQSRVTSTPELQILSPEPSPEPPPFEFNGEFVYFYL